MTRDELVAELLAMPANADIVAGVGHYRIDVTGIVHDSDRDEIVLEFPADDMRYALERFDPKTTGRPSQ
jgi:hypothetical protein